MAWVIKNDVEGYRTNLEGIVRILKFCSWSFTLFGIWHSLYLYDDILLINYDIISEEPLSHVCGLIIYLKLWMSHLGCWNKNDYIY